MAVRKPSRPRAKRKKLAASRGKRRANKFTRVKGGWQLVAFCGDVKDVITPIKRRGAVPPLGKMLTIRVTAKK